jgi:hypothetical protein
MTSLKHENEKRKRVRVRMRERLIYFFLLLSITSISNFFYVVFSRYFCFLFPLLLAGHVQ